MDVDLKKFNIGNWLPKSVLCLKSYTGRMFVADVVCRHHGRTSRAPFGDGIRDCVWSSPASRLLLRDRRGLYGFRFRRIFNTDWRPNRGVCSGCIWDCRKVRCRRPLHVHLAGRGFSAVPGSNGVGHGGQVHTAPGCRRFHKRLADRVHESGRRIILCGARAQPAKQMHQAEFSEHVGEQNICRSVAEALARAKDLYPEAAKRYPAGTTWGRRSTDLPRTQTDDSGIVKSSV